jgi:hypothetical protein
MKLIDRIIYFIFSSIIFIIIALAIMGLYDIEFAKNIIINLVGYLRDFSAMNMGTILIISVIIEIMAIKGMFFQSGKEEKRDAIILENSSGKLIISRKTLENLVKDIANSVNGVENAIAKVMVEKDTDLAILIDIVVKEGSIKDITKKLQEEVKMSIKKASDLNVAEVNVNIKNINKNVKIDDIDIKKDVDEKQEVEEDN